jgi:enhancing lycopene biosynthesis protein 2
MSTRVCVVLAGCGVYDGSEIQEAVLTLLALDRAGASVLACAPNRNQAHVINHLSGDVMDETRNVLIESARIVRGEITDLGDVTAADFDALVFPGGFGAAKNLSDFAFAGADMQVNEGVARLVSESRAAGKPIGFICISPTIAAKLIPGVRLTLGAACEASEAAEAMGASHEVSDVSSCVVDTEHKVVSTAAYMLGPSVGQVARGIDALVTEVLALA